MLCAALHGQHTRLSEPDCHGVQEYIVNLWTQDREMSQPWSMHTFQSHINNETGSAVTFDRMWTQMQKIVGEPISL